MAWTLTQVGTEAATASGLTVAPTLPAASTGAVGHPHLLVAVLINSNAGLWTPLPSGWNLYPNADIANGGFSHATILYAIDTAGGVTSVTFTNNTTGNLKAGLAEFDAGAGVTIAPNAVGNAIAGAVASVTPITSTAAAIGDLILTCYNEFITPAAAITWTIPSGHTTLVSDTASSGRHMYSSYKLSAAGTTISVIGTSSVASTNTHAWTGIVLTFTATATAVQQGLVGSWIKTGSFNPAGLTTGQAIADWVTYSGRPLTVREQDFTSIPAAITADLQSDVSAGRKVCMSFSPSFNPPTSTDLAALNTFLGSCKTAGLIADVTIFVDPPNVTGMTPALSIAAFQFYASTIRQYYPLVFVISAAGAQNQAGASFYPGDAFVDKVSTTIYASGYFGSAIRIDSAAAIANGATPPKPFGLWRFNGSTTGGGGTGAGFMGSTVNENIFPTGTSSTQAQQQFAAVTHRPVTVGKLFNTTNTPGHPSPFPTSPTAHMQGLINTGSYAWMLYWPTYIPNATAPPFGFLNSEKTLLTNSLNGLAAAGLKIRGVVLAQEPQNASAQLSAQCYVAMYQFFYSTVHALGLPLIYDAAGHAQTQWASYYPGDAFCDGVAVDTYGHEYTNGLRYDNIIAIADNASPPKPFGFFELGISIPLTPFQTLTQITTFMQAWQTIMVGRLNAGKQNLDCMWYNGAAGAEGINQNTLAPTTGTSPSRQTVCDTLYPAFVDAVTGGGGLTTAQITTFFGYVQTYFTTRVNTSLVNADIMIDNGNNSLNAPPIFTGDFRIPLYDGIFDALNSGGTGGFSLAGELDITATVTGTLVSSQGMAGITTAEILVSQASMTTSQPIVLPPIGPVSFPSYPTPVYGYFTTDLVTGATLGEIPVSGVSLDCQLNSAGNMTASGNLDDPRISNADFIARTIPGRTAFWAYRNNQIVWGGIIWTRQWQSKGKSFSITGQTFESYASRRFPRSVIQTDTQVYNSGQCFIIDDLWKQMQSVANGSIGVQSTLSLPAEDVIRQLTVNGWDLSTSYDDLIQSIIVFSNGPDYTVLWNQDNNGIPAKQLLVAPRIGNPVGTTNLVVDYPGTIEDYTYNEDASSGANQWWAVGDGTGSAAVTGEATDPNTLGAGWPLIEGVNTYSGVTDPATIQDHAQSDLNSLTMPLVTHAADLFGAGAPPFGSYSLGDYVIAYVTDPRFPAGFSFNVRVIGWNIVPADNASGVETITLVFDEPTGSGT
jgi:hypothetical protein